MSFHLRSPASPPTSPNDLKQRVIACLNKLADRDTFDIASAELGFFARNLSPDSFSVFINCLHSTDSSSKALVRKQCVVLLSLLSRSHGDSLAPHLSKMVSTMLRRLRDPDSSVRAACAAAAADMSAHVTRQPFASVAKPLIDSLVQEGDSNAQIGAAMCLAASVEAASHPEAEQLRKALPKLGKLLKSEGFKAKAALLGAIGSVISAGGAGTKAILDWLVPLLSEFLSSEDWAARKSAAEALGKVAVAEEELAPHYQKACSAALENKRFDKVKNVRETINRAVALWKEVPGDCDEASSPSPTQFPSPYPSPNRSSTDDGNIGSFVSPSRSSSIGVVPKTPPPKKAPPKMKRSSSQTLNRSYVSTRQKENLSKSNHVDNKGPLSPPLKQSFEDHSAKDPLETLELAEKGNSRLDVRRTPPQKSRDEKVHKIGASMYGSRVVPCNDGESSDDSAAKTSKEDVDESNKDGEDMSLIRGQLAQIENQQSNLLDVLQKFIGSSQSGIQSLESRVNGLETALDAISFDLAVSSGRFPKNSCVKDTCCKLPGTEFLSPKFWRKTEGRLYCSKVSSSSGQTQTMNTICNVSAYDANADPSKPESAKVWDAKNHFQDPKSTGRLDLVSSTTYKTLQNPKTR